MQIYGLNGDLKTAILEKSCVGRSVFSHKRLLNLSFSWSLETSPLVFVSVIISSKQFLSDRPFRQGPGFLIAFWNKGCRSTLYLFLCSTGRQLCARFSVQFACPCRPFLPKKLNSRLCLIVRAHRHCCCRFYTICSCLICLGKHVLNAYTNYCKTAAAADLSNLCKYCSLIKMKCVWKSFNLGRKSNIEF